MGYVGGAGAGGTGGSISLTWPAGVQAGDLAILIAAHNAVRTFTNPALFGAPVDVTTDGGCESHLWVRTCDGTETGTFTLVDDGTGSFSMVLYVVRGFVGIDAAATAVRAATSTSQDCPAATPTVADVGVLVVCTERITNGTTNGTAPTGFATDKVQFGATGSGSCYVGIASDGLAQTRAAAVAVDPGSWTSLVSASDGVARTILLAPAASSSTYEASGVTAATTTTAGASTARLVAAGALAAVTVIAAAATALLPTTGTVAASSTASGSASVLRTTSGTTAATTGATGSTTALLPASGSAAATTALTGSATVIGGASTHPASGAVAAMSTVIGSAAALLGASGSTDATTNATGEALALYVVGGSVEALSSTEGSAEGGTEVVIVTPSSRTTTVPAETRELAVEASPRVLVVAAESRTYVVPAEPRTLEAS